MVRGQSWRALSGVAGTRRLLADMKAARSSAKRINVHVSNRISRPDDVIRDSRGGYGRFWAGRMPPTCFKTVTKRSNAIKNKQSEPKHAS